MPAQSSQPRLTSRWGSFLQQAVAGVESRLDNILADDDSSSTVTVRMDVADKPGHRAVMTTKVPVTASPRMNVSRQTSSSRENDCLQERLAKLPITHNSAEAGALSGLLGRSANSKKVTDSPPSNLDSKSDGDASVISDVSLKPENQHGYASADDQLLRDSYSTTGISTSRELDVNKTPPFKAVDTITTTSSESYDLATSHLSTGFSLQEPSRLKQPGSTFNAAIILEPTMQSEEVVDQIRTSYEASEFRRQDETHRYLDLEHIDALQAKSQYLTGQATYVTTNVEPEAEDGSVERVLASKSEKIVLLMSEGRELAQNELKHLNTIRNPRATVMEDAKNLKETQSVCAKLVKAKTSVEECAREAEGYRNENLRQQRILQKQEIQLEKAKLNNDKRAIENTEWQQKLSNLQSARANEAIELKKLVEAQKKVVSELRDELCNAKLELKLTDERYRGHVRELEEKFNRGNEKARFNEVELRGELRVLESRFESLRVRAEDIASGSSGDTQAKLLRQIETLQTQYAVASENWRGIEGSLLTRISSLESERDEVAKREGEIRRKARSMASQCRQLEDQKEESSHQIQDLEQQVKEQKARLSMVNHVLSSTEAEVVKLQKELISERENWRLILEQKLETGQKELRFENINTSSPQIRTELPVVQNRQKWQAEKASPYGRRHQAGSGFGLVDSTTPSSHNSIARPHSSQSPHSLEDGTPHRRGSLGSTSQLALHNGIPEMPSSEIYPQEDFFDGVVTLATPERTINDMFSASTAAAGPSVQLVERMSAAVRRLESEKAATRDDLNQLVAQRDEARQQVVTLMLEAEGKRIAEAKILNFETEVEVINQRYQTTLEMLGEKSELVDELQADIGDLKKMYRDLVNSTMP
ncbi:hypothetical protein MMC26_007786 [Xylographa opegraphella]|nr:hypothetical protein [Xylographa opegraphella]